MNFDPMAFDPPDLPQPKAPGAGQVATPVRNGRGGREREAKQHDTHNTQGGQQDHVGRPA